MAEIINLRRARKAMLRKESAALAEQNRAKFGRTRQDRELEKARNELDQRRLDGHNLNETEND